MKIETQFEAGDTVFVVEEYQSGRIQLNGPVSVCEVKVEATHDTGKEPDIKIQYFCNALDRWLEPHELSPSLDDAVKEYRKRVKVANKEKAI